MGKNITYLHEGKDAYTLWKQDPAKNIVLDPQRIALMLNGGTSESIDTKTALAIQTLIELFSQSRKNILYQGDAVFSNQNTPTLSQQRPTLTILSGIPGGGKSTYAKQEVKKDPKSIIISNDGLRGILSGVEEKDINEKIWHTTVHSDVEHEDIILENFVFPEINNAKRALISTFLDHGYNVIGDAVHAKGTQWDDFDAQYAKKADIKHILVGPDNLLTGFKKATQREVRPENKETFIKVGKWIRELVQAKDEQGNPKYLFDTVLGNTYTDLGFKDITKDFYTRNHIALKK